MKDVIRCRLVCKLWKGVIDEFVLDELNLFLYERQYTVWFDLQKCSSHLNKSLSFANREVLSRLSIENEQFHCLFKNLKKLFFKQDPSWIDEGERDHDLEKLTSMRCSDHLQIQIPFASICKDN